jgi:hypothetical protein
MHFSHGIPNPLTPTLSPEYRGEGEMREASQIEAALGQQTLRHFAVHDDLLWSAAGGNEVFLGVDAD